MFDSIIAQKWDNIELILVNDGSTDGTRNVIADYEPKFKARGYEVVIVDQKNAGVCAAAKAGLECVTGDYVCCIDADDMLDPEYVSLPVSFLEENMDYDYTICSRQTYAIDKNGKQQTVFLMKYSENQKITLEKFLLGLTERAPWAYISRFEYFKKCRIIETYFTDTKGAHEPGFTIPLIAFGGKIKFLNEKPLYFFNYNDANSHSRHNTPEKQIAHRNEYLRLCDIAINALPEKVLNSSKKTWLKKIGELGNLIVIFIEIAKLEQVKDIQESILIKIINFINDNLPSQYSIKRSDILQDHELIFVNSVRSYFLEADIYTFEELNLSLQKRPKRIIFYGVLGKRGKKLLPALLKYNIPQIEFWDKNGGQDRIKQANFSELNEDDMLVVIPMRNDIYEEVKQSLKKSKCNNIISYNASYIYLHIYIFSQC
ncbi:MAG: glycosyltransferase [Fibromonadales bacterium]|nr:glycosyltransferase [Fibromonadales bacterium]